MSRRRRLRLQISLTAVMTLAACSPGVPELEPVTGGISREGFVESMIDLRRAAAAWEYRQLPPDDRDSILAERGVTPEDLTDFVERHGGNVFFMRSVWDEVESRLGLQESSPGPLGEAFLSSPDLEP
jgi:hypothetical protein